MKHECELEEIAHVTLHRNAGGTMAQYCAQKALDAGSSDAWHKNIYCTNMCALINDQKG